jgi:branched-chain amino acid transport system substrate-binding protein
MPRKAVPCLCALLMAFALITVPAFAADTIKIGAILSVTGPNAPLGGPEARTLQMLVDDTNRAGGILGRQIELVLMDSQGDADKAVSFARKLIDENGVMAIIGPSTSGESLKIKGLCNDSETILLSCAANAGIVSPVAKWVFKTPQMDSFAVQRIFDTMKGLGITRIGVVTSNSGFGQGGKGVLLKMAPDNGITVVAAEEYDKDATDLTAVLTKVKGQNVQAVVNWSTEPAQAIVAKNMAQLGFTVPLFQSHGFGNISYVQAAGKAAEGIIFPCGRLLVADTLPASNPQKQVLTAYKAEYEAKYKEPVSTFGGHVFDAFLVLTEGIRRAGSTDKAKVRDAIESIKGLAGTAGIFSFSPTDHNGLTIDSFEMLTVKNGAFVVYQK